MSDLRRALDVLVQKAKLRKSLSCADILEALAPFDFGPEHFDEILERLVIEGIEVIEDGDDFDDLGCTGRPQVEQRAVVEFDGSARELLKWATWIALTRGAQAVDREHLQEAAQAECAPPEPQTIWDIPFSPRVQSDLFRACSEDRVIGRSAILRGFSPDS